MIDIHSLSSRARFGKAFPILTITALGVLLVGCGPATPVVPGDSATTSSSSSSEAMMNASSSSQAQQNSSAMQSSQAAMLYKNGTFSADGVYRSPAGGESVHLSVVLKDDVVVDATFSGDATHPKSKAMQAAFTAGFKAQVVGKSLDDVSVGVVNGSSLTGGGFMDALTKIKAQAKA